MIFNTEQTYDAERASTYLNNLIKNKKIVEIKQVRQKRSISQNNYLHLILTWFAIEYGERLEYIKQHIFKEVVNPTIFITEYVNEKTGEIRDDLRSTSELTTEEMTIAIDTFRDYASKEAGIYLPEPWDLAAINLMELEIRKSNINY